MITYGLGHPRESWNEEKDETVFEVARCSKHSSAMTTGSEHCVQPGKKSEKETVEAVGPRSCQS